MSALTFHKMALAPIIGGLKNAHAFITKGYEHAKANNIDPNEYLNASIHPDMRPFKYQVYRFTDTAKFIPARINPDVETITLSDDQETFPDLLERIEKTIKYVESIDEKSFEGREEEPVQLKHGPIEINWIATTYIWTFAHPNFWFHVTTAYNILRAKGVDVGKADFLNGAGTIPGYPGST